MDRYKKLNTQKLLSILVLALGVLLLIFMITVEDEPGTIPLALIAIGTGWYFVIRSKIRSLKI